MPCVWEVPCVDESSPAKHSSVCIVTGTEPIAVGLLEDQDDLLESSSLVWSRTPRPFTHSTQSSATDSALFLSCLLFAAENRATAKSDKGLSVIFHESAERSLAPPPAQGSDAGDFSAHGSPIRPRISALPCTCACACVRMPPSTLKCRVPRQESLAHQAACA
eukprot:2121801-Pleurochrysis_carterae.AAC.3